MDGRGRQHEPLSSRLYVQIFVIRKTDMQVFGPRLPSADPSLLTRPPSQGGGIHIYSLFYLPSFSLAK